MTAIFDTADAAVTKEEIDALPDTDFCSAYAKLLRLVKNRCPEASIVCIIGDILNQPVQKSILAIAGSEFRYKIYRNNYLSAIVNVAGATDEPRNVSNWNTDQMTCDLGVGLQYGYDTVVGPLFATLHWSSVSRTVGAYLGLGFYF